MFEEKVIKKSDRVRKRVQTVMTYIIFCILVMMVFFTDERDQNWRFIDNLKFERLKLVLFFKT